MVLSSSEESDEGAKQTRAPYSHAEDKRIVQFIVSNNAFNQVKGIAIWRAMSVAFSTTDHSRSFHSLKNRFCKHIIPNISTYHFDAGTVPLLLKPFDMDVLADKIDKRTKPRSMRKKYLSVEDKEIIKQVLSMPGEVHGNKIWQEMEKKKEMEGRSWHSLRSRFLKHILLNLPTIVDKDTEKRVRQRAEGDNYDDSANEEPTKLPSNPKTKSRPLLRFNYSGHFTSPLRGDTPERIARRTKACQPGPSKPALFSSDSDSSETPPHTKKKPRLLDSSSEDESPPARTGFATSTPTVCNVLLERCDSRSSPHLTAPVEGKPLGGSQTNVPTKSPITEVSPRSCHVVIARCDSPSLLKGTESAPMEEKKSQRKAQARSPPTKVSFQPSRLPLVSITKDFESSLEWLSKPPSTIPEVIEIFPRIEVDVPVSASKIMRRKEPQVVDLEGEQCRRSSKLELFEDPLYASLVQSHVLVDRRKIVLGPLPFPTVHPYLYM